MRREVGFLSFQRITSVVSQNGGEAQLEHASQQPPRPLAVIQMDDGGVLIGLIHRGGKQCQLFGIKAYDTKGKELPDFDHQTSSGWIRLTFEQYTQLVGSAPSKVVFFAHDS